MEDPKCRKVHIEQSEWGLANLSVTVPSWDKTRFIASLTVPSFRGQAPCLFGHRCVYNASVSRGLSIAI